MSHNTLRWKAATVFPKKNTLQKQREEVYNLHLNVTSGEIFQINVEASQRRRAALRSGQVTHSAAEP